MAAALEKTAEVGNGSLFVIGDFDMLADQFYLGYDTDATLNQNIAAWALGPYASLTGHVTADNYAVPLKGLTVQLDLYQGDDLVQTVSGLLDGNGDYEVALQQTGTFDVRAKPAKWLSRRQTGVTLTDGSTLDWYFPVLGDVNGDNKVNMLDLGLVLVEFNYLGPDPSDLNGDEMVDLVDLGLVLLNFTLSGE
jgi:hypothetical protein